MEFFLGLREKNLDYLDIKIVSIALPVWIYQLTARGSGSVIRRRVYWHFDLMTDDVGNSTTLSFPNAEYCIGCIHRHALMLDRFNEGWIHFEGGQTCSIKGKVELESVLRELVARPNDDKVSGLRPAPEKKN